MASTPLPNPGANPGVSHEAFVVVTWTFVVLALITMSSRTLIRVRMYKKLQIDDYLLLFASACILTATIYTQTQQKNIFANARLNLNPSPADLPKSMQELEHIIHLEIEYIFVFSSLAWTTIYTAKFAYLWFFKKLITRMKLLSRYWWFVSTITGLAYIAALVQTFATCPWADLRAIQCSLGSRFHMTMRLSYTIMALDAVTDLMIFAIPVMVLWKVRLSASKKIGLALFLCLSVVLAAIAIVRISRLETKDVFNRTTSDGPWGYFWLQVEGCLAICLVSLTAFRSLFLEQERKRYEREKKKGWLPDVVARLTSSSRPNAGLPEKNGLASVPSATLTGLRTFFGGKNHTAAEHTEVDDSRASSAFDEETNMKERAGASGIVVTKTFMSETQQDTQLSTPQRTYRSGTTYYTNTGSAASSDRPLIRR